MVDDGRIPALGADKGYDRKELVQEMREHRVTPHFARRQSSIIDQRTTRHRGYRPHNALKGIR